MPVLVTAYGLVLVVFNAGYQMEDSPHCSVYFPPLVGNGQEMGEGRRNELTLKIVLQHVIFWNDRPFEVAYIL